MNRVSRVALPGRIFFMSDDADKIRAQLEGQDFDLQSAGALRDEVSTDEITPIPSLTYYDERLGRHVYLGLKAGENLPITIDSVKAAGFSVTVAGARYGKGSSREHSPAAELHAGIRLVIAKSFERIYRQNADNIGLLTTTDFSLIDRIRSGEAIDIEEIIAPRDALAASILRAGGLLKYGATRMRTVGRARTPPTPGMKERPMTITEKILARHLVSTEDTSGSMAPGDGAFIRADWRFIIEMYTGMATHMMHATFGEPVTLNDPDSIIAFAEHLSYIHKSPAHVTGELIPGIRILHNVHELFVTQYGVRSHGFLDNLEGSQGICHPMMIERYAIPGQIVVGTDSHTPHSGAIGCLAFGVGTTDMANAMLTGAARLTIPESLRIEFNGTVPEGLTGKDLALQLLAHPRIRNGLGVGKMFEFCGTAVSSLSIDERTTLTNMAAELGGFSAIVAPDRKTVDFLRERREVDFVIEDWMRSDAGARYHETISIDCSTLSPMVSAPGDPGHGVSLASLDKRAEIDIAFAGSCTGGKRDDFDWYHTVLSWAADRNLTVAPGVRLYLQFGTIAVRDYCVARGYLAAFEKTGATVLQPACGACANLGPGSSTSAEQVTVSAQNRNFPGRSGPGQVWLASPPTVAASAIAGRLVSFAELQQHHAADGPRSAGR